MLDDVFPTSLHVRLLGAGGATDSEVWQLARDNGCAIVTKDEDFHRMSVLRGVPPKVIWLRVGNSTTTNIAHLLRARAVDILNFDAQRDETFLELG